MTGRTNFHVDCLRSLGLLLASALACAAAPVPDAGFAPRFEVTGIIAVAEAQADNKTVVAGSFTTLNGVSRLNLGRLNADGSADSSFELSASIGVGTADYQALAIQPDGKILVGGNLWWFLADGTYRQYLARLNADGSPDTGFDPGNYSTNGLNGTVSAIKLAPDGKLVIAGDFTQVKGGARARIARLNADGSLDASFDPGTGANALVRSIGLQADGSVVLAGDFTSVAGAARQRLARLTPSGALDSAFTPSANDAVYGVAVQPDGRILLGGTFTLVNGESRQALARLNADGTLDALSSSMFWEVRTVLALPDNGFAAGGWYPVMIFNNSPTDHNAYFLRIAGDGTQRSMMFDGKPTEVMALALRPDGKIVAGGNFRNLEKTVGQPTVFRHGLMLMGEAGMDGAFAPVVGKNGVVRSIQPQADGKFLVAGDFNLVNGEDSPPVARVTSAGVRDSAYQPPVFTGGSVLATLLQDDGSLIAAGGFGGADGTTFDQIIRLNASGAKDASVQKHNINARALARAPDGKIYVGGSADAAFRGVARLNPADFSIDSGFNVGNGLSNALHPNRWVDFVNAMAVQSDGKLIVAGQFDQFNGTARSNIARLNSDGTVDAGFVPPAFSGFNVNFPAELFALALQPDGKVLVGGYFSNAAGNSVQGLVRLNSDGSLDSGFTAAISNASKGIKSLVVQADGHILAGGGFQIYGAASFNYFARLNPDGSLNGDFTPSFSGGGVDTIVETASATLIGGDFHLADTTPRAGIVSYAAAGQSTTSTTTSTSSTTTTTSAGGTTTTTASTTTTTLAGGGTASLIAGWNLLGNGLNAEINVASSFGNASLVNTVWKWIASSGAWAFYTPSLGDGGAAYAASKGYAALSTIGAGEGFWVNAKGAFTLDLSGTPVPTSRFADSATGNALPAGWSLIAIGDNKTPGEFANAISLNPPAVGAQVAASLTTLWAWDASLAGWYFFAPSLVNAGTQSSYIASKGYIDFAAANKTLTPTTGFWVNHP